MTESARSPSEQPVPGAPAHRLFEVRVRARPGDVAVISDAGMLSFDELDRRSNQLANRLLRLGVGPEVRVAFCLERSAAVVTVLLGILKAGGVLVPLNPSYPPEWLATTVADSAPTVLVTQRSLRGLLLDACARVVMVEEVAAERTVAPDVSLQPENLAYVIYTSGSTGAPKGVMVAHGELSIYLDWVNRRLLAGVENCLMPVISAVTFDASLKQILAPLLRGRPAWLPTSEIISQPVLLLEAMARWPRTALNCVPSLWRSLLEVIESGLAAAPESLKALYLGGENFQLDLLERTRAVLPRLQVWNVYGPTEAAANASAALIAPGVEITIGRPRPGVTMHLLDEEGAAVRAGMSGRLHVGGACLARGYLGRPGQTAERFQPDPFSLVPGGRLYDTGDLARRLPDGRVQYLGRDDDQVKVRGFRVELSEVEHTLARHPDVAQAVAVASRVESDEIRVTAYVVPRPGTRPADLRAFLRQRLPEHMVPSSFVQLTTLPVTSTGKLDRAALAARPPLAADNSSCPRTEVEELLAGIWASLLHLDRVGIDADFFALGGHSLLAVRLLARVQSVFRVRLELRSVFESPTLAGMAAMVERASTA